MRAADFREYLDSRPFEPFSVQISSSDDPRVYERTARVSLPHVVKLAPIDGLFGPS